MNKLFILLFILAIVLAAMFGHWVIAPGSIIE